MNKRDFSIGQFERSENLDVAKVLSTLIPDLAFVYGGFRGRTLSSKHQLYAWKTLLEGGVTQVVDLRADYTSDFYQRLCADSGVSYFHYPIACNDEVMKQMLADFDKFCEIIDKGKFYIACAMGLHRTDIALCLYWTFYAADKGIEPPPIRGYLKEKGLTTDKLMRTLNAFQRKASLIRPDLALTDSIFKERKQRIKDLATTNTQNDENK